MITFATYPVPVVTPLGDGYLLYVQSGEQFDNDIWTCVLCDGGGVRHFNTKQIKIFNNATLGIYGRETNKETKSDG